MLEMVQIFTCGRNKFVRKAKICVFQNAENVTKFCYWNIYDSILKDYNLM